MSQRIRKAAVLGAGIMGSGIAAHLANAGIPTLLLDIVPPKAAEGEDTTSRAFRDRFAAGAVAKLEKVRPSPIFSRAALDFIEVGNLDDDLGRLGDVDWVCEAIVENLDVKRSLFKRVEEAIGPSTLVSSNTSGLRIADMVAGRSESFRKRFLVTHFFNPVRYMPLLEVVGGPDTDPAAVETLTRFGQEILGKAIVHAKDTTNFVANRIGGYAFLKTIQEMLAAGLTVEEVDAIFGPPMAKPKSAVFRTCDVVGLDTFVHVADNCYAALVDDEEREVFQVPPFVRRMLELKLLGDKTGQGFYKKSQDEAGNRVFLGLDLNTLTYRAAPKVQLASLKKAKGVEDPKKRVALVLSGEDPAARFAEKVTLATLAYASRRIPEIADDLDAVDRAVRGGFSWDLGPFELWDAIGVRHGLERMEALGIEPAPWVARMLAAGRESFYSVEEGVDHYWDIPAGAAAPVVRSPRAVRVEHLKRRGAPIAKNLGASLWDMGDGVVLLEFHSKMNAIDGDIIAMLGTALDVAERDFRGLVIGNDAERFSVGANLFVVLMGAQQKQWDSIRQTVRAFQAANQRLRYSPIPVVTAPAGLALGGGAEVTMAGNAVQAAAESYIGLVEVGVGLIPGGGGNLQLLRNLYGDVARDPDFDPFPYIKKAFLTIGMARVAESAEQAREMGFLRATDGISMNRDYVLSDAKARAIGLAESGFLPPRPTRFLLPGRSGRATVDAMLYDMELNGQVSAHDRLIGSKLAGVLTGGEAAPTVPVTEAHLLELEAEAFLSLCGEEKTQQRMMHMLQTNKPLRN
jgi:3-hydroxyacyl-CoA dehydrogenase